MNRRAFLASVASLGAFGVLGRVLGGGSLLGDSPRTPSDDNRAFAGPLEKCGGWVAFKGEKGWRYVNIAAAGAFDAGLNLDAGGRREWVYRVEFAEAIPADIVVGKGVAAAAWFAWPMADRHFIRRAKVSALSASRKEVAFRYTEEKPEAKR